MYLPINFKKFDLEELEEYTGELIINEFEGSALEYEKTLSEKDYYLRGATNLLTIA